MTRAILPILSAREQWGVAGLTDRAASYWVGAQPPLDGGDDDEAGQEQTPQRQMMTMTTSPPFTSQQTTAIQTSNLRSLHTRTS